VGGRIGCEVSGRKCWSISFWIIWPLVETGPSFVLLGETEFDEFNVMTENVEPNTTQARKQAPQTAQAQAAGQALGQAEHTLLQPLVIYIKGATGTETAIPSN